MSQKRTLSSLRSGPGSPSALTLVRFSLPIACRSAPLRFVSIALPCFVVAQLGDGREHDLPMTERNAELLQVVAVQVRQGAKVDVIFGKDLGVFAQTETVQPILN